jgi:hypothetical protein
VKTGSILLSNGSVYEFNKKKPMTKEFFLIPHEGSVWLIFHSRAGIADRCICINIQSDKNHLAARETLFIFAIIDH